MIIVTLLLFLFMFIFLLCVYRKIFHKKKRVTIDESKNEIFII